MIINGQKINDRYQIIRTIGEGGMANVYLAYDPILDRNVAVKILRGDLANDEKFVRRFQREAISASSLVHPNIVEMYDVGESDGNYFIVMEYVDGKTLKSLIKKRGTLTLPEVIDIMLQLTSAISCAHDSYIIHRDIKPQNVMILDDGRVKIMDFGIAITSNAQELTQTNSVMGSVHYLPPEQANGKEVTIKSDIYSLGILMYELLIGKVPFKGENAVEIALKQLKEPIPSVCSQNPDIPQSIENIILKACAKNPKNRYDSCRDMYNDIKNALDESRMDEKRIVYEYPEEDFEETKTLTELPVRKSRTNKELDELEEKESAGMNVAIWILGVVVTLIVLGVFVFFIVIPRLNKVKDVKIPDVSGLTVEQAEAKLIEAGLTVNIDITEESSEKIDEGLVINTNPASRRTVKGKTKVTLIVSTGVDRVLIEDYKGMNYLEVKGSLKTLGLIVKIEKKKVADLEKDYDANKIVDQSIKAGEKVEKGTEIVLYTPAVIVKYPDFTKDYTLEQVQEWCEDNNITLSVTYTTSVSQAPGKIIGQSMEAGTEVNATALRITITKAPEVVTGNE